MSKKRYSAALTLLLTLSMGDKCFADQRDVERAEASVLRTEKTKATNRADYDYSMLHLAGIYLRNDMREKGYATYDKLIKEYQGKPVSEAKLASLKMRWAKELRMQRQVYSFPNGTSMEVQRAALDADFAAHKNDVLKAEALEAEALKTLGTQSPVDHDAALNAFVSKLRFAKANNRPAEAQSVEEQLDKMLAKDEGRANSPENVRKLARALNDFAGCYVWMHIRSMEARQLVLDGKSPRQPSFSEEDEKKAEKLRLRALRQWDRLPESDPDRIAAHREMALFYLMFDRQQEAKVELDKFARAKGTTDLSRLFPKPVPCLGCGMG